MDIARVELAVHANYMQIRYEAREQNQPLEYVQVSFGNPEVLQAIIDKSVGLEGFLKVRPSSYAKTMKGMPDNSYFYAKIEYKNDFSGPELVEMRFVSTKARIELHKKFSNSAPAKIREMIINRVYRALISSDFEELNSVIVALK